ncbi:extracellular solute-binding protein [Devosia sp. MC532]|uniref:ABC transporter substrate-binding protein n=1 Tax=Devosia sp. MC532 TaxID=2799788 RepID=UPI0018F2B668|nr:extracellular solute-binding protein [Devosia sp. MC532]MBJ7576295.1 extracellular solute-binding protein [Devosia sp. MC532]
MIRIAALTAALLGGVAVAPAVFAQDKTEVTFFIWAGSNQGVVPTEIIEAYRAANPNVTINILESNNAITYPQMVAARRTTPDNPLVHCGFFNADAITKGDAEGMWDVLDVASVPNLTNVMENFRRAEDRGVGYQMNAVGILYNKDAVPTPPTSWADLWSEAYEGRVTMFDYDTRMMAVAAKLNGGDEFNIDPGFKVWAENAKNFRALVDSNDAVKNLLVSGDAWAAPWFSSISNVWIEEGGPFAFAVPKEGAIAFPSYLAIVDGSDEAEKAVCASLINSLLEAENAGRYGDLTSSIPVVSNAVLTEKQKTNPMLQLSLAEESIVFDYGHIGEVTPDWRQRWDREVKVNMR